MMPVFVGGVVREMVERRARKNSEDEEGARSKVEKGVLMGSGFIAGEGVMGIGIAIAALILGREPNAPWFALTGVPGSIASLVGFGLLCWLLLRSARRQKHTTP